jgi:hypothetical protein
MAARSIRRRAASVVLAAGVMMTGFGLAGCAQPAGASVARADQSASLCAAAARVDRVVIRRVHGNPSVRISFPARVVVTIRSRARQAARAVCALPPMPAGIFNCPLDLGVLYRLTFTADRKTLRPVTLDAGGCQLVSGLGRVRWAARSPHFWPALGHAAGLRRATFQTFAGVPRS